MPNKPLITLIDHSSSHLKPNDPNEVILAESSLDISGEVKTGDTIFCEGGKLKRSLIDVERTYNVIDEIRARQAAKRRMVVGEKYEKEDRKWKQVIKYMKDNPETVVNILPSPTT